MATSIAEKTTAESLVLSADFADQLLDGETISSITSVAEDPDGELTRTADTISGSQVQFRMAGGSQKAYEITVTVSTSQGNTRQACVWLFVRECGPAGQVLSPIVDLSEVADELGLTDVSANNMRLLWRTKSRVESMVRHWCNWHVTRETRTWFLPSRNHFADESPSFNAMGAHRVDYGLGAASNRNVQRHLRVPTRYLVDTETLDVRIDLGSSAGQKAGDFDAESELTKGDDYFVDVDETNEQGEDWSVGGRLVKLSGWPTRARTVKVVAESGLTRAQLDSGRFSDIKDAVLQEIAARYNLKTVRQPGSSEELSFGAVSSVTYGRFSATFDGKSLPTSGLMEDTRSMLQPFRRVDL